MSLASSKNLMSRQSSSSHLSIISVISPNPAMAVAARMSLSSHHRKHFDLIPEEEKSPSDGVDRHKKYGTNESEA